MRRSLRVKVHSDNDCSQIISRSGKIFSRSRIISDLSSQPGTNESKNTFSKAGHSVSQNYQSQIKASTIEYSSQDTDFSLPSSHASAASADKQSGSAAAKTKV